MRESKWGQAVGTFVRGLLWGLGFWLAQPLALWIRDSLARVGLG